MYNRSVVVFNTSPTVVLEREAATDYFLNFMIKVWRGLKLLYYNYIKYYIVTILSMTILWNSKKSVNCCFSPKAKQHILQLVMFDIAGGFWFVCFCCCCLFVCLFLAFLLFVCLFFFCLFFLMFISSQRFSGVKSLLSPHPPPPPPPPPPTPTVCLSLCFTFVSVSVCLSLCLCLSVCLSLVRIRPLFIFKAHLNKSCSNDEMRILCVCVCVHTYNFFFF